MSETTTEFRGADLRVLGDEDARAREIHRRMQGALCGIMTSSGSLNKAPTHPHLFVEGAELTGVHQWFGRESAKPGAYHIGGYGTVPFEARIRILGETLERYAGFSACVEGRFPVVRASHEELLARGEPVVDTGVFQLFVPDQLAADGFPFQAFSPAMPMEWVKVPSLLDSSEQYVPAHHFLLGNLPGPGEPWTLPAVTTGTAAHTAPEAAFLSALYEIVQVDAAVGHWHSATSSLRIEPDARTALLQNVITRRLRGGLEPEFHLLPSPDLPGFNVACILRKPEGISPAISVGLGSGPSLVRSMYRALLETVGVQTLAGWSAVEDRLGTGAEVPLRDRLGQIFDLDQNVAYYAGVEGARTVEERFARHTAVRAGDLPADDQRPAREIGRSLLDAFRNSGKRLFGADFTSVDIRQLGFSVIRAWSPDTLSLPLPSAPPVAHPRFTAYGGFTHRLPHPYP
ncbi:YcaO-like family protein [Streptomyces sp. NPDC014734]|uniref:YcaO-like family protein n=1 Tax=Streptomyces sp. NPDC014734 TaxID=3364886 RepID=UPI0036F697CE